MLTPKKTLPTSRIKIKIIQNKFDKAMGLFNGLLEFISGDIDLFDLSSQQLLSDFITIKIVEQ